MKTIVKAITWLIAAVWLINGLFCKVLALVPRHEQIVARILGAEFSAPLTKLIGLLEIGICVWILSGIKAKICLYTQILLIASMNVLEYLLAPDLLLFGRMNIVFALLFIGLILFHGLYLKKRSQSVK